MLVNVVVGVFVGDAVIEPAIALIAARGVDKPGRYKQRSIAAVAAAIATASDGSSNAEGVAGISKPVARSGDAAPNPSATLALDCGAVDDVGGVV